MNYYLPPAGIGDFSRSKNPQDMALKWHEKISFLLGYIMGKNTINGKKSNRVSPLFYDHIADKSGVPDSAPARIPWNAFPLRLEKWFNPGTSTQARIHMYSVAEQLLSSNQYIKATTGKYRPIIVPFRIQDEYCEWHVIKDTLGSIKRIYFTCEPPEYWSFLAENDKGLLLDLYRELLHKPEIEESDLFFQKDVYQKNTDGSMKVVAKAGSYNPNNKWNTTDGAIHLTHPANSLYAEMFLASDSTLGWPIVPDAGGQVNVDQLMCCAGVGGINRSSDPLILAGVFNLAKQNNSVALANPIGLYMMPFQLDLLDPEGNQIGNTALKVLRSSSDNGKWLRVEISVAEDAGYTLDQCLLSGEPLLYGGQVAKLITMAIFGVAKKIPGKVKKEILSCPSFCCNHPEHILFKGTFPVLPGRTCNTLTQADWEDEAYDIPLNDVQSLNTISNASETETSEKMAFNLAHSIGFEILANLADTDVENIPVSSTFNKGRGVLPLDDTAPDLF